MGLFAFIQWQFNEPCPTPNIPDNVPKDAFYSGGCDGGYFFVYKIESDSLVRIKIFNDGTGSLLLDANYSSKECTYNFPSENPFIFRYMISSFNGNEIIIQKDGLSERCYLKPIYPAYGGEQWEILKSKFDF